MPRRSPSVAAVALGAAVLALVAGCAELNDILDDAGRSGPRTVSYDCDDGREFVARFSGDRDDVRVRTDDDEEYELEFRDRDGGRRVYSDDDGDVRLTIWDGGEQAELRIPDEADFKDCDADR